MEGVNKFYINTIIINYATYETSLLFISMHTLMSFSWPADKKPTVNKELILERRRRMIEARKEQLRRQQLAQGEAQAGVVQIPMGPMPSSQGTILDSYAKLSLCAFASAQEVANTKLKVRSISAR